MSSTVVVPPNRGKVSEYAVPSLVEARAVQAFAKGEATAEQQKIALNWIVKGPCGAGREIFAGHPESTAYLAGRLSVSLQIGWVLAQPVDAFRKHGETNG